MADGVSIYKKIAERKTASQRWNDLTDGERLAYTRLAEGVKALAVLHKASERDIAKYLMQYVKVNE